MPLTSRQPYPRANQPSERHGRRGQHALHHFAELAEGCSRHSTTPGRYVPDVAFYASPDLPGYLYCTSDTSDWETSQQASCNLGFRDSATQDLTVAGGTSFATPIFAGMVAILNQAQGYTAGQGLINPTLYTLASNATTYAAAFNDVPAGSNNECPSSLGANYCSTASEGSYATTTGYDPVTGLGSVNLSALVTAWPASTAPVLISTTTTVSASSTTPALNASDTFTITVTPASGTVAPGGTITAIVDGGTPVTGIALAASGSSRRCHLPNLLHNRRRAYDRVPVFR
jgi:subtilisin family serine protease